MPKAGDTQIRVLISGCLPPPFGGMASYYHTLMGSKLYEQISYKFVQTSTHNRNLSSSGRATFINLLAATQDCVRFFQALVSYHPNIAHIGSAHGFSFFKHSCCVFIAHLFGCRVLLHPHCSLKVLYTDRSTLWQMFFRKVVSWTNGIIALSQEWLQLSSIVPNSKIFTLPNPVDLKLYHSTMVMKSSHAHRNGPLRILYLGYIGKTKGSFDIVDTAILLRSQGVALVFDLVGSELAPGELSSLQAKLHSADLESCVRLNQAVFGSDKLDFFNHADIFIYPSYQEGMPIAILEAMACGLPIIASRVGGIPDLVKDGINGLLIDPGQTDQLAKAICTLANEPELRKSMQKMSYQIAADRFGIDDHVIQLVNIYEQVTSL